MSTTTTIHDDDDESLANTISIDVTTIWILWWWWWLITQWNIGKFEATIYIYLTSITTSSNILWIIYVSVYYVEIIEPSNTIGSNAFIYILFFLRLYIYMYIVYTFIYLSFVFESYIYIIQRFLSRREQIFLYFRECCTVIYSNFDIILIYILLLLLLLLLFLLVRFKKWKHFIELNWFSPGNLFKYLFFKISVKCFCREKRERESKSRSSTRSIVHIRLFSFFFA